MNTEDKRTKLIKEIMRQKKFYSGIFLSDLYKLIRNHPNFDSVFGSSVKNNPEQYKHSTRALLQHRAPGMTNYKGKHKDFIKLERRGLWTYYGNPRFSNLVKVQKDVISKMSEVNDISNKIKLNKEEKHAIVKVRLNQSLFRKELIKEMQKSNGSPFKGIKNESLLIASHILDYADCSNEWERSIYHNGLILTPDIDKLFDKKFLSFDPETGKPIFKNIDLITINKLGLKDKLRLPNYFLTRDRKEFLELRNKKYKFI